MIKFKLISFIIGFLCFYGCQKNTNIDRIYIDTNQKISSQKTNIQLFINNQKKIRGTIKTRGGYSIIFPKKSYEIDLFDDVKLLGLPKDDDWILNANFIDKTFLRHVISYEIFQDMNDIYKVAKSKYIELYVNDNYEGLYVLMQKLDKSSLKIQEKDESSFIFKDPHIFRENYNNILPQKEGNLHQQIFPKLFNSNKNGFLEEIRDFILNSNDSIFSEYIVDFFDINNIIDWHLLLLMTNNSDGVLKNFYMYKINSITPIRISPWDYDHSFGRDGDNELNLNSRKVDLNRSILFNRLMSYKWYKTILVKRWENLNEKNILSVRGLKKRVEDKYNEIDQFILKNNKKWSIQSHIYFDDNNSKDEIKIMLDFIELRHLELTEYFKELI